MENEFNEVAARAVLAYLYDHDMYKLAEQFCMANPYLETDRRSLQEGNLPVNFLHKPLKVVMKEFIVMQSQLLQLVNLCSGAISFPQSSSILELVDHLIKVLKSSGTGQVLKTVISTLPACIDWSETHSTTEPQPVPPNVVEHTNGGTVQGSSDMSFSADSLLGQDLIITASDMSLMETITRCVELDTMPLIMENAVFTEQPSAVKANTLNGIITVGNIPPASGTQSNQTYTSTPSASTVPMITPQQTNQSKKPTHNVTLPLPHDNVPTATTNPSLSIAKGQQQAPSVSKANTEKLPPPTTGSLLTLGTGVARSNATPLDNPIVPGAVSSRSTSSRKQSHIRILDFGTPPVKRGSPSVVGPSPVIPSPIVSVPQRSLPVLKLTPTVCVADRNQPPVQTANEETKPKKVIVKRRLKRYGTRKQIKRIVGGKLSSKKLVKRTMPKRQMHSPDSLHQQSDSINCTQPSNVSQSNRNCLQPKVNASTINMSPAKSCRPPSASPTRAVVPGSPSCPVDPLAVCPMTPRFLTRPLQPLCMLSPLLGTLDASAISHIKSTSHTKQTTDINTPRYPITPGNTITPSPPTECVSYYESEPGTVNTARKTGTNDETDDSETDRSESPGVAKPQLTLAASEGSEEISIQYVERERFQPVMVEDREFNARLAARIEIDNGNRVFQIAVSPLITLYEDYP
ncbi:mucin-17-like [Anopheles funestus]|uniref:mucin-17-like n=1 Tax=Anopheles funestus TaxID=62324 RepID=UPI0020C61DAE|nr:mucin-17-like [Anopheles funestus]